MRSSSWRSGILAASSRSRRSARSEAIPPTSRLGRWGQLGGSRALLAARSQHRREILKRGEPVLGEDEAGAADLDEKDAGQVTGVRERREDGGEAPPHPHRPRLRGGAGELCLPQQQPEEGCLGGAKALVAGGEVGEAVLDAEARRGRDPLDAEARISLLGGDPSP